MRDYISNQEQASQPQKFQILIAFLQHFSELTAILQKYTLVAVLSKFVFYG